ncbi:MAG: fructose-bisphosphatase class II family protein [Candidatus Dormibacteraeota bacterium]|nr:fructose-bisphosphatase class II family protein [Candidatus Dormibacteraeota bacterium]
MEQPRRGIPSFQTRHELAFDLVYATEAAALACARLLGKGDPDRVSEVAAEAMRRVLEENGPSGTVVLGPRNDSYLPHGTSISGGEHRFDLGLFPVEGASQVARGSTNAVSIVAAVEPGGFPELPAVWYVEKIVAGPAARGGIDLDDPIADNLRRIAFARDARVQDLTVAILDRPRHQDLMAEVASAGARILSLEEGDIAGAVMAALPGSGIDAAIGIGGMGATLVAACAVRCLGGELQARLWPRNPEERLLVGDSAGRIYGAADLAPAADVAVALTGVTGGQLLPGVLFGSGYAETASLLMSSRHATVRRLTTRHHTVGDPS